MTHSIVSRFRARAVLVPLGALALIAGGSTAAFAGTTPTPAPISSYGAHHHTPKHCELVLLTGSALDQDGHGQDVGGGYGPQTAAPDHGSKGERNAERVKVEQLAEVCETGEHLTVFDVTRPFAQETEPTPTGYPAPGSPNVYVTPAASAS
jgi:hypothetical protein